MKKHSVFAAIFLMVCLIFMGTICTPDSVSAKELTKISQVKKLAKKQVKGASVVKVEKDDDDGVAVFEAKLSKGKKQYDLVFRASDSKLLTYEWEIKSRYVKKGSGKLISAKKCKSLAKKQVSGGRITSLAKKNDDGISIYKVKMKKSNKKYTLKFHARTGKLLEYEWELTSKNSNKSDQSSNYISEEEASRIALAEAGGGTITKIKFEVDDGIPVYEIEIINGNYEYEIKVHAQTGRILETEKEPVSGSAQPPQQDTTSQITVEAAKEIALTDAGVSAADAVFTKAKLDREDGIFVYEIEFVTTAYEYEYEINASTGAVYSKKKEALPGGGSSSGGSTTPTDIGIEAAKEIALTEAGGGTVVKAKADTEDGIAVYEIEIINGEFKYDITVSAQTGKILEIDKEYKDSAQQPSGGEETPKITLEAAKEAAIADAGLTADEVTFTKTKLDREDGILVYELEFVTATHEYEYEINASTGAVYSKKKEVLPGGGSTSGGGNISGGTTPTDIGLEAAIQIALKEAGGITIEKAERETEDGVSVYEVKIINGGHEYEIKIDAQTGNVLEVDIDSVLG